MLYQEEGCASISDPVTGELLFYTDGITIWNGNHRQIDSHWWLKGNWTTTQSALIIPRPGSSSQYYLFQVGPSSEPGYDPTVYLTIVDMAARSGEGAVTMAPVAIGGEMNEKLTAVPHGNGCSYWVIGHKSFTNEFVAWNVGSEGIEKTIVTAIGEVVNPAGYLKASPDGTMLAMGSSRLPGHPINQRDMQLFKFDAWSGVPSDPLDISEATEVYGVSFSPDSRKLYVVSPAGNRIPDTLVQYDVSVYSAAAINASRTIIPESAVETPSSFDSINRIFTLQLAPNGKLYIGRYGSAYLDAVENPNAPAPQYRYRRNAVRVSLDRDSRVLLGLPNIIDGELYRPRVLCEGGGEMGSNRLMGIVPIPADGNATISYQLKSAALVTIVLYDVNGRAVRSVLDAFVPFVEERKIVLSTDALSSGVYYLQMRVGDWTETKRLLVVH